VSTSSDRGASSDSYGAPRTKEKRLESEDTDLHSPNTSLRDKITDYFSYNNPECGLDYLSRSRSSSPEMPVLLPQVELAGVDDMNEVADSPPQLSDCDGSEQSYGHSDSGKENEETEERPQPWPRQRSDSNKMKPLQSKQPEKPVQAAGRVTRSASGKLPLSLKGCENLQNELNQADTKPELARSQANITTASSPPPSSPAVSKPSPPTPHKIIRVKESINPLQKLKSISLTPKKSTKKATQTKRQTVDASASGNNQQQLGKNNSSNSGSKAEKLQAAANTSHKVTEYFPIRRSERKPKAEILKEELETIQSYLGTTDDSKHGIEIANIELKGRGIKAVKSFNKGDFVVEYAGDLIDIGTAKDLEAKYSMDASKGCYMYYFKHRGKQYCIDATAETGRFGRLVNHSRVSPNCITKVVMIKEVPRLMLVAKQSIETGEEILYDYGDRSKESLKAHPWLAL